MNTLYIFGNGFDLAHGINTRYSAFRSFLVQYHDDFLVKFEDMYNIRRLDDTEPWYNDEIGEIWHKNVIKDLWEKFEDDIGYPNTAEMFDFAVSMSGTMPSQGVSDTFDMYWKEKYSFSNALQKYVLEWLKTIDMSYCQCKKADLIDNNSDYFINFNYTDILERVYNIKNVLHIHGGIPECSSVPPVMGHGNKFLIDDNKNKAKQYYEDGIEWAYSIHKAIAKYAESLYKDTDMIISQNENFFSELNDIDQIICLGITFGDVDIPYLERIMREVSPQSKWIVYFYTEEDKKRLKAVFGILGITRRYQVFFRHSDDYWD